MNKIKANGAKLTDALAKIVMLETKVETLPMKYDTMVTTAEEAEKMYARSIN